MPSPNFWGRSNNFEGGCCCHLVRCHEQMSVDIVDLILGGLEERKGHDYVESVLPESQV